VLTVARYVAPAVREARGAKVAAVPKHTTLPSTLMPPVDSPKLAVVMVENGREDWSFGRGQASYLELPRAAWR